KPRKPPVRHPVRQPGHAARRRRRGLPRQKIRESRSKRGIIPLYLEAHMILIYECFSISLLFYI
ncbi:hypothetical protein ACJX0J_007637, partial [Zea mays]